MSCPPGWVFQAGACYRPCQPGYTGDEELCLRNCPDGWRSVDTGAGARDVGCERPSYGRGAGYLTQSRCVVHHRDLGCERYGLLWYPRCQPGYEAQGCCVCRAQCPSGSTPVGLLACRMPSYTRGSGVPPRR